MGRNVRLGRTVRSRLALSSAGGDLGWAESPLGLASSIAFVVLSSATEVGVGEGLLRGHVCGTGTVAGMRWAVLELFPGMQWLVGGLAELYGHLDVFVVGCWLRRVSRRDDR